MTALADARIARGVRVPRALLAAVAALAVVAAGWWLGGLARAPGPAAAPPSLVSVGGMQLELAPAWTRAQAAPGPEAPGAESFAPAQGLPARALLLAGPPADASLVPAVLRGQLPDRLPRPRATTLAGLAAWTYGPIRSEARVIQVTLAPTTGGVLAVACSAPPETWTAAFGCEAGVRRVASTADALTPAPDLAFRQQAPAVLRALDGKRVAGRAALARGRRVAAARSLARAHRTAAAALAPFAAPGATADAVAALRRTAGGYDALAGAAGRPPYIAARQAVARAEAGLAGALKRLR